MYTTDIQDGGTVSATDEGRLPPGGFSLRNGFPSWFGRTHIKEPTPQPRSSLLDPISTPTQLAASRSSLETFNSSDGNHDIMGRITGGAQKITIYEVLRYIRSTFDDEIVLDQIPLEAAGNPGAWHAWQAHRIKSGAKSPHTPPKDMHDGIEVSDSRSESRGNGIGVPESYQPLAGGLSAPTQARSPGEWNWEGVWEVRAKKGIDTSISDSSLYGKDAGDDLIHFMKLDGDELNSLKKSIEAYAQAMEPRMDFP